MESTQTALVLDALVTAVRAGMPTVEVIDGQPVKLEGGDSLIIGWSPARPAVEVVQERTGISKDRRHETLTIACVASTWRGDTDITSASVVRAAAVLLLDNLRTVLIANRTLGGIVSRATLGYDGTLDQAQTSDGAAATFDFTITVTTL